MERGHGRHRPTKSQKGKWVEEDIANKSADTLKVIIKSNFNQRRMVFMNLQMLQHRRDKAFFSIWPLILNLLVENAKNGD
jgi:hypothetical protein